MVTAKKVNRKKLALNILFIVIVLAIIVFSILGIVSFIKLKSNNDLIEEMSSHQYRNEE